MPEAPARRAVRKPLASTAPEPRFARIAAAIGDPTRARMLAVLLSGELVTAGEIAQAAGVTPQTASAHLALLEREQLVLARTQGRHRYFRLADAEVARALFDDEVDHRGPPAWVRLAHRLAHRREHAPRAPDQCEDTDATASRSGRDEAGSIRCSERARWGSRPRRSAGQSGISRSIQ